MVYYPMVWMSASPVTHNKIDVIQDKATNLIPVPSTNSVYYLQTGLQLFAQVPPGDNPLAPPKLPISTIKKAMASAKCEHLHLYISH